jgi:hypothetical protein
VALFDEDEEREGFYLVFGIKNYWVRIAKKELRKMRLVSEKREA